MLEFFKFLKKIEVVEGSSVKLEGWVYGKLELSIEWYKDDEFVIFNRWVKIYFDLEVCRLIIFDIVVDDEGEYKCVVINEFGSVLCFVELFVNEVIIILEFEEKLKYIEVIEGDIVWFDVCVVGNFKFVIEWLKGGKVIVSGGRFKIVYFEDSNVYFLFIENVLVDDFGSYKCVVFNEVGRM